jgi:hypothetical protein
MNELAKHPLENVSFLISKLKLFGVILKEDFLNTYKENHRPPGAGQVSPRAFN